MLIKRNVLMNWMIYVYNRLIRYTIDKLINRNVCLIMIYVIIIYDIVVYNSNIYNSNICNQTPANLTPSTGKT